MPCFCYGHSSICNSSQSFHAHSIAARFDDPTKWQAIDVHGNSIPTNLEVNEYVSVSIFTSHEDVWFLAPKEFLGNQLHSYAQELTFELRLVDLNQQNYVQSVRPSRKDIVLQSSHYNLEVYLPIYGASSASKSAGNQLPSNNPQIFTFKLDQYSGWMPTLTSHDFQRMLSNLSSIKIRASYVPSSKAILSELNLNTAKKYLSQVYNI